MDYPRYREAGWPIGSGLVEGQCKFVVGRRFKGNGTRSRPHDNRCALRTRLALLNGDLKRYFSILKSDAILPRYPTDRGATISQEGSGRALVNRRAARRRG